MVGKRKVLKSQLPLAVLVIAATAVALTIIYFVYRTLLPHSKCDSIFEQTTDRLRGNLDVVKTNGELVLGRERVQELTEGSQKVALPLEDLLHHAGGRHHQRRPVPSLHQYSQGL